MGCDASMGEIHPFQVFSRVFRQLFVSKFVQHLWARDSIHCGHPCIRRSSQPVLLCGAAESTHSVAVSTGILLSERNSSPVIPASVPGKEA